ncbi:hypothetical protein JOF56_003871 [Kibdelosporangium banguiense]|uniref:Uncharacterized protein n=1 Tax=Kibdelosporangium banguiense TaxID=1365924 RepID=A0ABS4TI30_9PSEU|nr:hypothetical protein [Kibdelosporangium banguiense]MBP2323486.1 hypothetical protein [Kibdelosporangium banguiense]
MAATASVPESACDGANDEWAGIARVGEAAWAMADVGSMSVPTRPAMAR